MIFVDNRIDKVQPTLIIALSLSLHTHRLDGKHVVFGAVVEGYDPVVKTMESFGSESGKYVLVYDMCTS